MEFSAIAKYCCRDGEEYLLGIHRGIIATKSSELVGAGIKTKHLPVASGAREDLALQTQQPSIEQERTTMSTKMAG